MVTILSLQNKLHHIDENYKQGYIDDTDNSKPFDDPYEHQGQAQVSDVSIIRCSYSSYMLTSPTLGTVQDPPNSHRHAVSH